MRQLKLQTKLFLAYAGLAVLILLAFSTFFYVFVSKQLIRQEINSITAINSSFKDQIDTVINDMDVVSININFSNLVKNKLGSMFNLNISRDTLGDLASLFVTINGADIKVDQIHLYDLKGNMLKVGIKTNTATVNINNITWFKSVLEADGRKTISRPYYTSALSPYSQSYDWFISLYRSYNNQYGQTLGVIETIKSCKGIFKSIISYEKRTENPVQVYIYAEDNTLIYPYDLTEEERESIPVYSSYLAEGENWASIVNPKTGGKEYLAYSTSDYSGWKYITVQHEALILKPVNQLLRILMLFVFALLAVSMFVSFWISRGLVKPIKHLKHIFQRIEIETLGKERTDNYPVAYNELNELYLAFQHMSENLKNSMNQLIDSRQQELKSRALALQSQINPHFYYNTLSSIIILTENEQPQEVITVCRNLSQIMRYITDTAHTVVSVKSEIDYVNKYLYCMKVRYQSSLRYTIDIDDVLLQYEVPKLIIQPLVENAVKYCTECNPPWNIRVIGRTYDTHWQIDIIDSGNGFSREAAERVASLIREADNNPGMPEMKIDGLGILNVYMRWKLFSGDRMIFSYGNTEDGHGIVTIGQRFDEKKN